ncbi:hypothetical protein TrRE_jg5826 [Triparma retinervis]|uniref:Uncharacterized protein n=1 Tax=Triparma retinervis TaxID=2557542 RepID=A0A9W7AAM1_9STRA|nr:hypothetical protein TrRE_jg5826 [Triparma retinervis]
MSDAPDKPSWLSPPTPVRLNSSDSSGSGVVAKPSTKLSSKSSSSPPPPAPNGDPAWLTSNISETDALLGSVLPSTSKSRRKKGSSRPDGGPNAKRERAGKRYLEDEESGEHEADSQGGSELDSDLTSSDEEASIKAGTRRVGEVRVKVKHTHTHIKCSQGVDDVSRGGGRNI